MSAPSNLPVAVLLAHARDAWGAEAFEDDGYVVAFVSGRLGEVARADAKSLGFRVFKADLRYDPVSGERKRFQGYVFREYLDSQHGLPVEREYRRDRRMLTVRGIHTLRAGAPFDAPHPPGWFALSGDEILIKRMERGG